jgi:hypothetical protein
MTHDDPAIRGSSSLIRHINPDFHVSYDENIGGRRISSSAFSATSDDPDFGMSVDIGQLLDERNLSESTHVPSGMGAVRLRVAAIRNLALRVGSDPVPGNDEHGQVWDAKSSKRRKILGVVEDWVVAVPGVAIR